MAKAKYRIEGEDATGAAFRSVLGNAKKTADGVSSAFRTAFAGISLASIIGVGRRAIESGDQLKKFADKARLSAEQASTLAYAAKLADVELDGLGTSLNKMFVFLSKASEGQKTNLETLRAIGIEYRDIKDLRADEQFELIADAISRVGSEADQHRAEVEIFGKAGGQLHDMFMRGAEGIREARKEAEQLGLTFSDKQLAAMAEADDSINRLSASWDHFAGVLASKVAPNLEWVLDRLSGAPKDVNERIADLEEYLRMMEFLTKGNFGAWHGLQPVRDQIKKLRNQSYEQSMREMGVVRPGDPAPKAPPGYAAGANDGAAQAEEEKRAAAFEATWEQANDDLNKYIADANEERWSTEVEHYEQAMERQRETEEELNAYRTDQENERLRALEEQRLELSAMFTDAFADGREGWDNLLEYWKRKLLFSGLDKLMGMLFSQEGGRFPSVGRIFGFARGGRPPSGVPYVVGEEGPELRIDGPGNIVPNHKLGGTSVTNNFNVDARGATMDVMRVLPRMFKEFGEQLKAEIIDGIRKRHYPLES